MTTTNTNTNNAVAGTAVVVCPNCGSAHLVKNGKYRGNQRYLCKDCGKSFTFVPGDAEAASVRVEVNVSTAPTTPTVSAEPTATPADVTTTTVNDDVIDFDADNIDEVLSRAHRDSNGNFMLRVNGGAPAPIGTTIEDIKEIVRSNGECRLTLDSNGVFVLRVATTTKG